MPSEITMPKLSDTMEEGKVLRWLKAVGESVERGDAIAEIETDKADMEMEAFDSGVLLKIAVAEGQTAAVGDVIGWMGKQGERVEAAGSTAAPNDLSVGDPGERGPAEHAAGGRGRATAGEAVESAVEELGDEVVDEVGEKSSLSPAAHVSTPASRSRPPAGPARDRQKARAGDADREGRESPAKGADRHREKDAVAGHEAPATDPEDDEVAGPHADIAEIIEPDVEEEAEGEEGSSRQAPVGRPSAAAGAPRPTKGMNDRLPTREPREERAARAKVSPLARKLAAGAGFDPATLEGSGPNGRVVRQDVEDAIRLKGRARPRAGVGGAPAEPSPSSGARPATEGPAAPERPADTRLGTTLPHSRIRRAIAARMAESKRTVPHFYTTVAVRMEEALKLKIALELREPDSRVSVTHLLVKACALSLERHPRVNGVWEEEGIRIPAAIDVGIAVAVEDGLIVPVVRDCARKPLLEIAREARALVERVKAGRPGQDDLQGATFTVSNMGMFAVESFAAIIAPPQSAILAVGAAVDEAIVRDGSVAAGKVMRMTLSADHRVIDGALAAAFLVEVARHLENPLALVL